MAEKKDDTLPFDAVDAGRTAAAGNTATGMAKRDRDGELAEEDHSDQTLSETAEEIKPDYMATKPNPLVGQQKEEARFTSNGSIPLGMVASNSGFVPASSVERDPERAAELVQQNLETFSEGYISTSSRRRLDDAKIQSMSGAELRAVATDRGYDMSTAMGTRASRAAFTRLQGEDKTLEK
jgi:hypothetical protein